jgi:hypothetical protein
MRILAVEITPTGRDRFHAGALAGFDVAHVVADIDAALRRHPGKRTGMQQRCRVGLAQRQAVAGHHCRATPFEVDRRKQRAREPAGLVCHHAPADAAAFQRHEHLVHAGVQSRVRRDCLGVQVEKAWQQQVDARVIGVGKTTTQHGPPALRNHLADRRHVDWRFAEFGAQALHRHDQVRRRIDERAVQIEEHGLQFVVLPDHPGLRAQAR